MSRVQLGRLTLGTVFLLGLLGFWYWLSASGTVSQIYLPGPDRVWSTLLYEMGRGELPLRILKTLEHMALGWLLASTFGIGLGVLVGTSALARRVLGPTLEFFRPLPASAIFPVAIAVFGLSDRMVYAVIAFGALWPTLLATINGFENLSTRLKEVRALLGMSRTAYVWKIGLPYSLPEVLAGMRLSLTVALILSVTGEILSSSEGLGHWIMLQARSYRSDSVFAGVMLFGVIGLSSAYMLTLAERRILRWKKP